MNNTIQYAVLILVAVSAVMAVASYFATRREVDDVKSRLGKMEDRPAEYVEKPEFQAHVEWNRREHENLFSKMGGVERGALARMDSLSREWREFVESNMKELMHSNNEGREKLHNRINEILDEVAEIRGSLRAKNQI